MSLIEKRIDLHWFTGVPNLGDALNPYLLSKLFSLKVNWVDPKKRCRKYFAVGSILGKADNFTEVWGSGFISDTSKTLGRPLIHAVRGPLTEKKLNAMGIACPKVYGDPALLLPQIYFPKAPKKFKVGIIPHYVDKKAPSVLKASLEPGVKVIDIQNRNVESFIDQILSCELIISSSLHGLIIADAYGVPNVWMKLSDKIVGGNFKFNDYFLSVGRSSRTPLLVSTKLDVETIVKEYRQESVNFDPTKLLKSNPFR